MVFYSFGYFNYLAIGIFNCLSNREGFFVVVVIEEGKNGVLWFIKYNCFSFGYRRRYSGFRFL